MGTRFHSFNTFLPQLQNLNKHRRIFETFKVQYCWKIHAKLHLKLKSSCNHPTYLMQFIPIFLVVKSSIRWGGSVCTFPSGTWPGPPYSACAMTSRGTDLDTAATGWGLTQVHWFVIVLLPLILPTWWKTENILKFNPSMIDEEL